MATTQQLLDQANETTQQTALRQLLDEDENGFGLIIASMVPGFRLRAGLTSSATHVEDNPGRIHAVLDEAGAAERAIIHVGVAGAGEVLVVYDAAGVATLTFGDGANTGYQVEKSELPKGIAAALAAVIS